MMIGHVFRKILHFESQQIPVFSVFAPKRFFFDEKIAKNEQKMRKIEFLPIFSKFPQMFLKGVLGVWGVSGSSKRAILAYLKQWKLSRIG